MNSGRFPTDWNVSLLSMIHKNGNKNECNNYRGISIGSCLGKVFTKILQSRISNYLEDNELLSDNQAGFRKNYRTTDQIYILKTILNKYLHKNKKPVYACFIDFSKAFDTIWREALLYKLNNIGIAGKRLIL